MPKPLNIAILAAGAAGMICGSCLRDNNLALALRKLGHEAMLVPLYTPLKVDAESAAAGGVYYGGINVYLQHAMWLFRHTPRFLDWMLDRPGLLRAAGDMGAGTPPAKLAGMTRTMLMGGRGGMVKELRRLIKMLRAMKPDVISLPNLMFAGVAEALHDELKVPVVVELTGEDIFLEAMAEKDQGEMRRLIRACVPHVAGFMATSRFYGEKMATYLGLPTEKIVTVYPGVPETLVSAERAAGAQGGAFRVGHLARIDPAKGLDVAHTVVDRAREMGAEVELHYAGWEGSHMKKWHAGVRAAAKRAGEYHGEVDLAGKIALLDSLGLLLAPAPYAEAKGLYVLEAMARGVPIVAARQGAFLEIVGEAGVLVTPGDVEAYAREVVELSRDRARREAMGAAGKAAVRDKFTDTIMAERMVDFYASHF